MRITLSGAMRARDVSRPTDEQLDGGGRARGEDCARGQAGEREPPRGPGARAGAAVGWRRRARGGRRARARGERLGEGAGRGDSAP